MQLQRAGAAAGDRGGRPGLTIRSGGEGARMRSESLSWAARGAGLAGGVGLILVLASVVVAAREIVLLVFIAVLLGAALEPVVATIRARTRIGRGFSILVVYAAFLAGVVAIAVFIVPAAV